MAMDYVTIAQGRLTNQFSEKPLVKALAGAMVSPLSNNEAVADKLKNERWISTSIGYQLDGCGYIVGETRQGRDDDAYRKAILFRIFVNTSNATPEDLMHGLRYLTDPDNVQYMEQYPATAILFTDGPNVPKDIQSVMQDLSPAAICDVPVMVSFARATPFRFSKEPPLGELFVNSDADYLTGNGSDIQVTFSDTGTGSRLGGIAPSMLDVGGFGLDIGGSELAINSPNFDIMIESGYHLTGLYS